MSLDLHIRIGESNAVTAGDACWLIYSVTNSGSDTESLLDPDSASDRGPAVYVRGGPGARRFLVQAGGRLPAKFIELSPGQAVESAFRLDGRMELRAGSYEAVALIRADDDRELRSNRLEFEVRPAEVASLTVTPIGLPAASRVYFSWIAGGRYCEQQFTEGGDVDTPAFQRDEVVERLSVPEGSTEPWTATSGVFYEEPKPLRWIFYRNGQRVTGKGPRLIQLPFVDLPDGAGAIEGAPVMGAKHRADLFYRTASEILVARFIDPEATPQEATGIIARAALPGAQQLPMRVAIDPPDLKTDRRHVVLAEARGESLALHHCTISGDGVFSPFRRYEWKVDARLAAVAGRPAVAVLPDGTLMVRLMAEDADDRAIFHVIDAVINPALTEPAPLRHQRVPLQDKPHAARVCLGGSEAGPLWYGSAWWMDDGTIVSSVNGGDLRTVRKAGANSAPPELIALEKAVYVVQIGDLGIELLKV